MKKLTNSIILMLFPIIFATAQGTEYLWSNGETTDIISVSPSQTTTYYVTITENGVDYMDSVIVFIYDPITTTISGDQSICIGDSTTLTVNWGSSYLWNTGDTTASITVSPTQNTTYDVMSTNALGCTAHASRLVQVLPNPSTPTITPSGSTTFCQGGSVTLNSSSGLSYLWSPGGDWLQTITVNTAGEYTVTVSNNYGCKSTSLVTTVVVNSNPSASFTFLQSDLTVDFLGSVGGGAPAYSYLWDFGDGSNDNILAPTHFYNIDGLYDVTFCVTDDNTCTDCETQQVNIFTTSVAGALAVGKFSITPNPNSGNFTLNLETETQIGLGILEIYSATGQLVQSLVINSQTNSLKKEIDLDVAEGLYTIRLTTNGNVYSEKLIVK